MTESSSTHFNFDAIDDSTDFIKGGLDAMVNARWRNEPTGNREGGPDSSDAYCCMTKTISSQVSKPSVASIDKVGNIAIKMYKVYYLSLLLIKCIKFLTHEIVHCLYLHNGLTYVLLTNHCCQF